MPEAALHGPTPEIVLRAAQWAAELDADDVPQALREPCDAWCAEDARHRLALDRMRGMDARFEALDLAGRNVLSGMARRSRGRRGTAPGLIAAAVLMVGGWMATQSFAIRQFFPDYQTARGEMRTIALADGTNLSIDTDSAVDVETGSSQRRVILFRGQVMAEVAHDAIRPFVVETNDGTATALGTVFSVRREPAGTVVTVIESRVRACAGKERCIDLRSGERARIANGAVQQLTPIGVERASAWSKGWLEADEMPLTEALAELNRYRTRSVRFDAAALTDIYVTGSYPLTDPERSLRVIANTTGLVIEQTANGVVLKQRR